MSRSGVQIPLHPLYNKEKEGKNDEYDYISIKLF